MDYDVLLDYAGCEAVISYGEWINIRKNEYLEYTVIYGFHTEATV